MKDKTEERYKKERDECQKMKKDKIKVEVVDLTKQGIDDEIKSYLSLGPDFCEAPTRVPYEKIIAETEKMCSVIGRFQKISIPIPRTAFRISEGEGGFTIMEF